MKHIQKPESEGAVFVLPSQLNGAEYPSESSIVTQLRDYIYDNTGGPRGQLAVHPGAGQFVLDNAASSRNEAGINAIDGIQEVAPMFKLMNGYMVLPGVSSETDAADLFHCFTRKLHTLRPLIMHDVQAKGLTPDKKALCRAKHQVSLVYASAVPMDAYMNYSKDALERKLHRKVCEAVLVAQYYGSLRAVADRNLQKKCREPTTVYLLPLGGGVFNNPWESIVAAMVQAVALLANSAEQHLSRLRIEALAWEGNPTEAKTLEEQ